jgi:hypothetical protein
MINNTALSSMSESNKNHSLTTLADLEGSNSTTPAAPSSGSSCGSLESHSVVDGPFAWDSNIQGLILSSYFIGYLITEVRFGAPVFSYQ